MEHTQTQGAMTAPGTEQVSRIDEDRLVGSARVLAVLKALAGYTHGAGLDELTREIDSPKPTVHRALVALRRAGLADQDDRGRYVLGDEFLRLAFAYHEARPEHVRLRPALESLAARFGETAHYAVLDGREVVYRAKVDPPSGAVRLTSTIGGRNPAHATAVGKLLLAQQLTTQAQVAAWVGPDPLASRTARTLRSVTGLHRELKATRERGFGIDDQENEIGIHCVAVPVFTTSLSVPSGAVSISALAYRTSLQTLTGAVDDIRRTLGHLGQGER